MEYAGFIASFSMGIILGLMGGGGSILTVPILVYLFSLSPTISTAYSLFVVGTTALIGSAMYIRKGEIDLRAGFAFALLSVVGVNISRGLIIPKIPSVVAQLGSFSLTKDILVMVTFSVLMVSASYSMIKKKNERKPTNIKPALRFVLIAIVGLTVGLIAGFVGAGGGFLIIPALIFILGLSMRIAVGTSLMIIAIQSLLGFAGDVLRGLTVNWSLLLAVAAFAVIGIIVGSELSQKFKEQKLKKAFGWLVLSMGLTILLEQLRHLSL